MSKIFNRDLSYPLVAALLTLMFVAMFALIWSISGLIHSYNTFADDYTTLTIAKIVVDASLFGFCTYSLIFSTCKIFNYTKNWIPPRGSNPASVYHHSQERKFRV